MVTEVHHIASPLSGRFIKPRGERGWGQVQVLVVDYTSQVIYNNSSKTLPLPFLALFCLIPVGLVLQLAIES